MKSDGAAGTAKEKFQPGWVTHGWCIPAHKLGYCISHSLLSLLCTLFYTWRKPEQAKEGGMTCCSNSIVGSQGTWYVRVMVQTCSLVLRKLQCQKSCWGPMLLCRWAPVVSLRTLLKRVKLSDLPSVVSETMMNILEWTKSQQPANIWWREKPPKLLA